MAIKRGDFGLCRTDSRLNQIKTKAIGTPIYSDPNIYTKKCDVYSMVLTMVYIFCGICMTHMSYPLRPKNVFKGYRRFSKEVYEKTSIGLWNQILPCQHLQFGIARWWRQKAEFWRIAQVGTIKNETLSKITLIWINIYWIYKSSSWACNYFIEI